MNLIENVTREMNKKLDEVILQQFERHGYTTDDIFKLTVSGRIKTFSVADATMFCVDDEPLFSIQTEDRLNTDSGDGFYTYSCNMVCRDLREINRREN